MNIFELPIDLNAESFNAIDGRHSTDESVCIQTITLVHTDTRQLVGKREDIRWKNLTSVLKTRNKINMI